MKGETLRYEVNPLDIRAEEPFSSLFPVDAALVETIAASIRASGFDPSQPIAVWHGVVVDGHTRLKAAKRARIGRIPCIYFPFESEYEALCYAYERQKNRRPESDADLLRAVGILDASNRKSKAESARENGAKGGRPETHATGVAPVIEPETKVRSSQRTATALGISRGKVEKIRKVLDDAAPEVKAAVLAGEKTVNAAYNETVKPKAPEPKQEEGAERPTFRCTFTFSQDIQAESEDAAVEALLERLNGLSVSQLVKHSQAVVIVAGDVS